MNALVAIVGPTGAGKTDLAIRLAKSFNGEIISADSRQVYRYMDIGTAKPTPEQRASVQHHLVDYVDPDEDFGLAQYQQAAYAAILDIENRNRLPFLVGGTGQYIWAVLEGWQIPKVVPEPELRQSLETRAREHGIDRLYAELKSIDPAAAEKIDARNIRRVIRALEVYHSTKKPFSELKSKHSPLFRSLIIGLTVDREELYRRVDARVDNMVKQGLIRETQKLLDLGYNIKLPSMSGIGYSQIIMYLNGAMSLEDAIEKIKTGTHRFIRHQYAWFKLNDKRIHWLDINNNIETEAARLISEFLKG